MIVLGEGNEWITENTLSQNHLKILQTSTADFDFSHKVKPLQFDKSSDLRTNIGFLYNFVGANLPNKKKEWWTTKDLSATEQFLFFDGQCEITEEKLLVAKKSFEVIVDNSELLKQLDFDENGIVDINDVWYLYYLEFFNYPGEFDIWFPKVLRYLIPDSTDKEIETGLKNLYEFIYPYRTSFSKLEDGTISEESVYTTRGVAPSLDFDGNTFLDWNVEIPFIEKYVSLIENEKENLSEGITDSQIRAYLDSILFAGESTSSAKSGADYDENGKVDLNDVMYLKGVAKWLKENRKHNVQLGKWWIFFR